MFDNIESDSRIISLDSKCLYYTASKTDMRIQTTLPLIALSMLLACASGQKHDPSDANALIGKWEGIDRTGKLGAFHFHEDGALVLIIDGKPLGEPGGLGRLMYTADFSKKPIELDIIGIDAEGSEQGRILMIVHFISPDRIKIRTYFNDIRPDGFTNETVDDTIILDRSID